MILGARKIYAKIHFLNDLFPTANLTKGGFYASALMFMITLSFSLSETFYTLPKCMPFYKG